MKLVGLAQYKGQDGVVKSTLHVIDDFAEYQNDASQGRVAKGQSCEAIYVGSVDVSGLKIGDTIEILYGKAVKMKDGNFFQPVKAVKQLK